MRLLRWAVAVVLATFIAVWAVAAVSADFTQPKRDVAFTKASRRADKALKASYGNLVPSYIDFCHQGRYQVVVHRDGLDRRLTLIPVMSLEYPDLDSMRAAARKKPILVGALEIPYLHEPNSIEPGTHMLVYDGLRIQLRDTHNTLVSSVFGSLGKVPDGAAVDPALGTLAGTAYSLSNVTPEGRLEIYIQLTQQGQLLKDSKGFSKVLLSASIPGLVTDDQSPDRNLAKPKEEDKPKE
jgi:hypothetical protein